MKIKSYPIAKPYFSDREIKLILSNFKKNFRGKRFNDHGPICK